MHRLRGNVEDEGYPACVVKAAGIEPDPPSNPNRLMARDFQRSGYWR
jgi:hypothetical protein